MHLPDRLQIDSARAIVAELQPPTPTLRWPLLEQQLARAPGDRTAVWVKHENHTPVGAFKVRGGAVYLHELMQRTPRPRGVISATRGNHGQSIALAAARHGLPATIVVPHGNSREKNAAMRALGVNLVEHGEDFQAAREYAEAQAAEHGLHMVPAFHSLLLTGVATYSLEFLRAVPDLEVVYVPIGLGSSICGMIAARNALGLRTRIVGVVSAHAPAYARSFEARQVLSQPVATRLADGLAVRTPDPQALEILLANVDHIVEVTDAGIAAAMRTIFECTHHVAEGAGAASLAAAMQEREQLGGRRVGTVLSGANVDREVFARVLSTT